MVGRIFDNSQQLFSYNEDIYVLWLCFVASFHVVRLSHVFSYNVLIKSIYLFLYLFIFFSSLLFTNVSHFHLVKICFNQLEHTFPSLCILHYVLIYNLKKKLNHIHNIHKRNGQIDLSFNYNMYTKKYWSSWIPEKWLVLHYRYKYHQCHFNMYIQYHRR